MRKVIPLIAALLLAPLSLPLEAQDEGRFADSLRHIDPHAEVIADAARAGGGLVRVAVSDAWKRLDCEQKKKLAGTILVTWERTGGARAQLFVEAEPVAVLDPELPGREIAVDGCEVPTQGMPIVER